MQINSCLRLPKDSFSFKICQGKWKERYRLSTNNNCLQNIKAVAFRVFIAISLVFAAVIDLCIWSLRTIAIIPAVHRGSKHFIHLISLIALPILAIAIPFGYNPKTLHTKPIPVPTEDLQADVTEELPAEDLQADVPEDPLSDQFDSIEKTALEWAEECKRANKDPRSEILHRNRHVSFHNFSPSFFPRSDIHLITILTNVEKLLLAGADPNEVDSFEYTFSTKLINHLLESDRNGPTSFGWKIDIIRFLLRPRHYDNFPIIKVRLNEFFFPRNFRIAYYPKLGNPEIRDASYFQETILTQILAYPAIPYKWNVTGTIALFDRCSEVARELIKCGANVNLDFEQYKTDCDKFITELSPSLWPKGLEGDPDDFLISDDLKKLIETALGKYSRETNFYISVLGKLILIELFRINYEEKQRVVKLNNILKTVRLYIDYLITNKGKFEQAQQAWLARKAQYDTDKAAWWPKFEAQFEGSGLRPTVLRIVEGYSEHY